MRFWSRTTPIGESSTSTCQPHLEAEENGPEADIERFVLPDEELDKTKQGMRRVASSFGEIVALLLRFDRYKKMPLEELEWRVVPAIIHRQYSLVKAQSKAHGGIRPVGLILWASVSDDVDRRLSSDSFESARLKPKDWTSGDNIWVVDAIGEPKLLQSMMKHLADDQWSGRVAKIRLRNSDGSLKIAQIRGVQAA